MTGRLQPSYLGLLFGALLLLPPLFLSSSCSPTATKHSAAIASAHPLATQAGIEVLEAGGNAFDAAVAVSAALAVVEPYGSGIGGGGFWLLHRERDGHDVMIDGRERAPLAATRDMYLDEAGEVIPGLSINGALAAGIPGQPAALVHIANRYGRLPVGKSLEPAIRLARSGFTVDEHYRRMASFRLDALRSDPSAAGIFLQAGDVPAVGTRIIQANLARTLDAIARRGHKGFYGGEVARKLVEGVNAAGGIWTLEDLKQYSVLERKPVVGKYRDYTITSAAPPSSGGIALLTMLNILSGYNLAGLHKPERVHLIVEAMRRAYRDRAEFLGDPDFIDVPVHRLTSLAYARILAESIMPHEVTPSSTYRVPEKRESGESTTHFSVLDKEGNRVAATLSINYPFGAAMVPPGTGVLLNDEMDDFSVKPGVPNAYGLVGAEANAVAPGKRPLSSMSPTFVEDEQGIAVLGTPGGSRIITMVLLGILDLADGNGPESWVSLPRFHHQYLPDKLQYEVDTFDKKALQALAAKGHQLKPHQSTWGNMQAIYLNKQTGEVSAASDPRLNGLAVVTD